VLEYLAQCESYRKLLLLVSDGEPSDVDIANRRYLVEDAGARGTLAAASGASIFFASASMPTVTPI